jgi:hypothetical protein
MSEVINEAETLRLKLIALLVTEREAIDEKLALVGYDGMGRPAKKTKVCSVCGSADHNARTCDSRKAPEAASAEAT